MGFYCAGGSAKPVACAADTANPYLGATASSGYCSACYSGAAGTRTSLNSYTSYAGADYCTLAWSNVKCDADNQYWDASANACVPCPAGTSRDKTSDNLECQPCNAGYYSKSGGACTACPKGSYNPTPGLGDQDPNNADASSVTHCLRCPRGSLPLSGTQSADTVTTAQLTTGATFCDAW